MPRDSLQISRLRIQNRAHCASLAQTCYDCFAVRLVRLTNLLHSNASRKCGACIYQITLIISDFPDGQDMVSCPRKSFRHCEDDKNGTCFQITAKCTLHSQIAVGYYCCCCPEGRHLFELHGQHVQYDFMALLTCLSLELRCLPGLLLADQVTMRLCISWMSKLCR